METVFQNHFVQEQYQKPLVLTLVTGAEQFGFLLLKEFKIGMLLATPIAFRVNQVPDDGKFWPSRPKRACHFHLEVVKQLMA